MQKLGLPSFASVLNEFCGIFTANQQTQRWHTNYCGILYIYLLFTKIFRIVLHFKNRKKCIFKYFQNILTTVIMTTESFCKNPIFLAQSLIMHFLVTCFNIYFYCTEKTKASYTTQIEICFSIKTYTLFSCQAHTNYFKLSVVLFFRKHDTMTNGFLRFMFYITGQFILSFVQ